MQNSILNVENLAVIFKDRSIIDSIDLVINSGDLIMLSGENGSGKSTLIKALAGAIDDGKVLGKIEFENKNILNEKDIQWYRQRIVYVEQENLFMTKTVCEEIEFYANIDEKNLTRREVKVFLEKYGLQNMLDRKISVLSGGQKKMLAILTALIRDNARMFFIDEPLNNLDIKNVCIISDLITDIHFKNPQAAIILISHCRIFPNINREIAVIEGKLLEREPKQCHSCFGEPDSNGYYNK